MTKHMRDAGGESWDAWMVEARARAAERFVAELTGGTLRPEMDRIGDLDVPGVGTINVKSVPSRFRCVATDPKPAVTVVVVEDAPGGFRVAGVAEPDQFVRCLPPLPNPQVAWVVLRRHLTPAPPGLAQAASPATADAEPRNPSGQSVTPTDRLTLGVDDAPAVDRRLAKRIRDRLAKRRQRARDRANPEPLWGPAPPIRYGFHKRKEQSMSILIVGEDPLGLEAVSLRLAELAGLSAEAFWARTEYHSCSVGAAEDVWPSLVGRQSIILGPRVGVALGLRWAPLKWMHLIDGRQTAVAILPDPNGPWWSEATNRSAARRFMRATYGTEDDQ